jgi:hypothetical protein
MVTSIEEAQTAVEVAKAKCPRLRVNGILYDGATRVDNDAFRLEGVAHAIAFLRRCKRNKIPKPNKSGEYDFKRVAGSYALKHVAEDWAGSYIANSELIAAALYLDFDVIIDPSWINVLIGIDGKSVDDLNPKIPKPLPWQQPWK